MSSPIFDKLFENVDQRASATITVDDYTEMIAAAATGAITYGVPDVGDTVIVDGNTFTCVAESPGAGEFSTIGELEALVEAVTGVNSSEDGTTIAVTAASAGVAGNAITLALGGSNTGTMAISGATLTGGQEHLTLSLAGVAALVQGTDYNAETDEATTAGNLATAIAALTGYTASAVDNVVTVWWETPGTAGNAKTIAIGENDLGVTLSGGTLSGGVAAEYTEWFDTEDTETVESFLDVQAWAGSGTLDITPQIAIHEEAPIDQTGFTQVTAVGGDEAIETTKTGRKMRYKYVLGGTNTITSFRLSALEK